MQREVNGHVRDRERIIASEIEPVTSDIALLDVAFLIGFTALGKFANLASIVTSSIELTFRPSTLCFGHGGSVDVDWDRPPVVTIDMQFHSGPIQAYFRLLMSRQASVVELDFIQFGASSSSSPVENSARLLQAMRNARISR